MCSDSALCLCVSTCIYMDNFQLCNDVFETYYLTVCMIIMYSCGIQGFLPKGKRPSLV